MIEINCLDDVPIFLGAQRLTDYFRGKVGYLLATYDVDSLKSVGSVLYVTTPEDWEKSEEIGLSRPMKDYMAESANVLKIPTDSGGMIRVSCADSTNHCMRGDLFLCRLRLILFKIEARVSCCSII